MMEADISSLMQDFEGRNVRKEKERRIHLAIFISRVLFENGRNHSQSSIIIVII